MTPPDQTTRDPSEPGRLPGGLPRVSVIVPVHDGTALLRTCVQALLAQDYPGDLIEVLVVDNASTEDVAAALPPDPRVRLLHEPVPGSYRARNAALPHVRGEVVAFTDADCRPHPDWITRGVAALRSQPDVAMVGGRVDLVFREGHPVTAWEVYEAAHAFPQRDYLAKQHFAVTANVLTWRTTLEEVGGFDARLASRGDAEWGQRVARSGGKQVYADDAVVDHPARATWKEMCGKTLRVARGRRDVDVSRSRGRRHFLGVAAAHVRLGVVGLARPVAAKEFRPTPAATLRYVAAYSTARVLFVGVNLATGLRPRSGPRSVEVPEPVVNSQEVGR
ncbi:glycosyltransferase [Kineococcus sp. GCM10028916]|uniref:glycosyltransferase n=1 Tax=Kineococcus sp. GCM10028916 TaxID=3273394 RepID=UPI003637ACFC